MEKMYSTNSGLFLPYGPVRNDGISLSKDVLEKYKTAGRIAAEIKQDVLSSLKSGVSILELTEYIENQIKKKGAVPAFPVGVGINEILAHYTPNHRDIQKINPGDLVKIDIGTHVDGYIADMAFTYCSEENPLVSGVEEVLNHTIGYIKSKASVPNLKITIGEIGRTIEEKVKNLGLGLVENLAGHTLDRYLVHGPPAISNTSNNSTYEINTGQVIALELFIGRMKSSATETNIREIYSFVKDPNFYLMGVMDLLNFIKSNYGPLPFARRWLSHHFPSGAVSFKLEELERIGAIRSHPVIVDLLRQSIAQTEHTIVMDDKPIITTKLDN